MLVLASSSFAQSDSFKHDIGLKISSWQPERFQLQYRYHFNESWAFSANAYVGTESIYFSDGDYLIQDSLYEMNSSEYRYNTYGVEFGAIRKLNFMKHNFYYVGASAGFGGATRSSHYNRMVFTVKDADPTMPAAPFPYLDEVVDSEYSATIDNAMAAKSKLFVGADFPILDRLSFNCELGMMMNFEFYAKDKFNYFTGAGYFSGGLRYNFGKVE